MGSQYSGAAGAYPAELTIPADADPITASNVTPALEDLGDRTEWLRTHHGRIEMQEFEIAGTWVAPAGVHKILVQIIGGGGGGGGGGTSGIGLANHCGGGGGGAAIAQHVFALVTPGSSYAVGIGVGGAGGASGANGTDGGTSFIDGPNPGGEPTYVYAAGGQGGCRGATASGTNMAVSPGGGTIARGPTMRGRYPMVVAGDGGMVPPIKPGEGGWSASTTFAVAFQSSQNGGGAPVDFVGGAANTGGGNGLAAGNSGSYVGGSGGGGGGSSAYGVGGNGGAGGAGNNGGAGGVGSPALATPVGSYGAGGGGGGAGGAGSVSNGAGGKGGDGQPGLVRIFWLAPELG